MSNDQVLAQHILDAISHIESYSKGVGKEEFLSNLMLQDAVVRNLEIIGEVRKISNDTKGKFPGVPWSDIVAMRNILVHEYFRTDAETVWNVLQLDLSNGHLKTLPFMTSTRHPSPKEKGTRSF